MKTYSLPFLLKFAGSFADSSSKHWNFLVNIFALLWPLTSHLLWSWIQWLRLYQNNYLLKRNGKKCIHAKSWGLIFSFKWRLYQWSDFYITAHLMLTFWLPLLSFSQMQAFPKMQTYIVHRLPPFLVKTHLILFTLKCFLIYVY